MAKIDENNVIFLLECDEIFIEESNINFSKRICEHVVRCKIKQGIRSQEKSGKVRILEFKVRKMVNVQKVGKGQENWT